MKHRVRRLISLAALAGLLTTLGIYLAPATPANALPPDFYIISGNFFGDARDELFEYRRGTAFDQFQYGFNTPDGVHLFSSTKTEVLNSTYRPVAGDFDGDGYDEIFWHTPNTAADTFWNFDTTKDYPLITSVPGPSLNAANWVLTVGDYSNDGADDIFLHRPGSEAEAILDFDTGSSTPSSTPTSIPSPHALGLTYVPMSGHFADDATDDLMLYNAANGQVSRWDFEPGGFTTSSTAVYDTGPTGATPITLDRRNDGGTDLYLYVPSGAPDEYWDINATGDHTVEAMNVQLSYTTASGNFLNDNGDDIYWAGSQTLVWDHYTDATGLHKRDFIQGSSLAARSGNSQMSYTVQDDVIIDPKD